jgi:hypothetical protein
MTLGGRLECAVLGSLFSHSFLPKSWIYLALNESQDRSDESDNAGYLPPKRPHIVDRAAVLKVNHPYFS